MKNWEKQKAIGCTTAVLVLAVYLYYAIDFKTKALEKSVSFIESEMTRFTEGDYEEKSIRDFDLVYLWLDKKEKEKIISISKSLVDTKFYELGNTLYRLQLTLNGPYITMKAIPLYDQKAMIEEMAIPVNDDATEKEFIEAIRKHVEKEYTYANFGFDYEPLDVFLLSKKGLCYNFVEMFYLLAEAKGMKVRVEMNQYHAWNLVEIDGEWTEIDLTLDLRKGEKKNE